MDRVYCLVLSSSYRSEEGNRKMSSLDIRQFLLSFSYRLFLFLVCCPVGVKNLLDFLFIWFIINTLAV